MDYSADTKIMTLNGGKYHRKLFTIWYWILKTVYGIANAENSEVLKQSICAFKKHEDTTKFQQWLYLGAEIIGDLCVL